MCSLTDGLVLAVEIVSKERGAFQEQPVSSAKARLMLSWDREGAVKGGIEGAILTLDRLQGGAFERFISRDELRQSEYYRCVDSQGVQYQLRASYPLELERDQEVRTIVASFWRMISWIDDGSIKSFTF